MVSSTFLSFQRSLNFEACKLLLSLCGLCLFWLIDVLVRLTFRGRVILIGIYHFFVISGSLIPLSTIILFSGLVPLGVVDLFDTFLLHVGPVDGLGVVVGDVGELGGLGDRVLVLVDELDKLVSLFICYLNVLAYHNLCFFRFENLISKPAYCF